MGRTIESAISLADEDPRGGGDWLRTPAPVLRFHTISTTTAFPSFHGTMDESELLPFR